MFCLVSRWGVLPESNEWYSISIIACSASDSNSITIADGWSPHDHGSTLSAAELLRKEWYRHSVRNGQHVYELEPPGWFERRCALLQCSWFFDLPTGIAVAETVSTNSSEPSSVVTGRLIAALKEKIQNASNERS